MKQNMKENEKKSTVNDPNKEMRHERKNKQRKS